MSAQIIKVQDVPTYYNAVSILEGNLAARADKIALYSEARTMTFGEVSAETNQVGNSLKELGIRFGDCVGILAPDSAEWATSFFGIVKIGAVAVCLNTLLESAEYDIIFGDCRIRALIVHETLFPRIAGLRDKHPSLQHVIVIGQRQHPDTLEFTSWVADGSAESQTATTHRDDYCSLHYSSGTTGLPKGMFHAHKDYKIIAHNAGVQLFGMTENDRTFSVAKLFFVYGMGGNMVHPWNVGASIVLYGGSPRMAPAVLATIDKFKPTIMFSAPTGYIAKLATMQNSSQYELSSLRLCLSAGEALPESVWLAWKEKTGLEIIDLIGCTETYYCFLANRPGDIRPGSTGKPTPGYEVRIIDEAWQDVPTGEIGNLIVKGDTTVLSYLHQYEKSRHTFRGQWFVTGDKYYKDEDGFYWHAGRSDDMLKVGGLWVSPVEVESVLVSHPAVLECAVVGYRDAQEIVTAQAFVTLAEGQTASTELIHTLLRYCRSHLAMHKCPRRIEFVDQLPKTATGKIKRHKLREKTT